MHAFFRFKPVGELADRGSRSQRNRHNVGRESRAERGAALILRANTNDAIVG